MGLFYDEKSKIELQDGCSAQYGTQDEDIRFVAIDNEKRGVGKTKQKYPIWMEDDTLSIETFVLST